MTSFDPETRLPVLPLDAVFNNTAADIATSLFSVLAAAVFLYGIKHWRDTKSPIVLMMMIGGLTTTLAEPFVDVVGGAWYPIHGQNTAFELMGRPIPLWVIPAYLVYFGIIGSFSYMSFAKGASMRTVWLWFSVPLVFDVAWEEVMMHYDLYYYYGNQPLILLWKFPFWWTACNSIGELLGVAMVVLLAPVLRGWKVWLIPVIMPVMDVIGYAAVGVPSMMAVNTEGVTPLVRDLAGVATFVLTGFAVWGVALLIGNDSPLRRTSNNVLAGGLLRSGMTQ